MQLSSLLRSVFAASSTTSLDSVVQEPEESIKETHDDGKSERILANAEADAARIWELEHNEHLEDL